MNHLETFAARAGLPAPRTPNPALKTDWFVFSDAPAAAGHPVQHHIMRRDEYGRTESFGPAVPQPWAFDLEQARALVARLNAHA